MMTLPNIITLSRIALIPVFVGLFYLQPGYLEGAPLALINKGTPLPWINNVLVVIFILISASDFVDGLLARKLNQISAIWSIFRSSCRQTPSLCCSCSLNRLLSLLVHYHTCNYNCFKRNPSFCT